MKFMTAHPFPDLDTLAWSTKDRSRALDQARTGTFDLVIIGGGITGAGLAREAALRRIPFLLADQEDFAAGTSSRSSKLAHGGFRYLAQGEFRLVREAATERNWLRHALPNLVRPLAFHLCARAGGKDTPARVRAGIVLYDLISNTFSRYKNLPHRFLTPDQLAGREPAVDTSDLLMAGVFHDALVDDARLVLETLKEARDASGGRAPVLNYVRAARIAPAGTQGLPGGCRWAVDLEDRLGGARFTVTARCVVNATGAWADETLRLAGIDSRMIRPTKGVHLVVPNHRIGNREAFVLRSARDGRTFFVLRRGDVSVIGTTDTDFPGPPAEPWCEGEDCDYLLDTVNRVFPGARLTRRDVIATSAGIRPLVRSGSQAASAVSRRHLLLDPGTGLVTIAGGKLTTFRAMAWEVLDRCARAGYLRPLRGREAERNFTRRPYKVGMTWAAWCRAAADLGLDRAAPEAARRHLHQQYGSQGLRILREVRRAPSTGEPLLAGHPFCAAEVCHILDFENAPRLPDVMLRRTEMQMLVPNARQAELADRVAGVMACHYGWDAARAREEREGYLDYVRRTVLP